MLDSARSRNTYSSVGWTFLVGAMVIQWYTIAGGFLRHMQKNTLDEKIEVGVQYLIDGASRTCSYFMSARIFLS